MYDKDVCKAGVGFCLVVGGTVITGWWVIGIALALVVLGLFIGRWFFGRNDEPEDES